MDFIQQVVNPRLSQSTFKSQIRFFWNLYSCQSPSNPNTSTCHVLIFHQDPFRKNMCHIFFGYLFFQTLNRNKRTRTNPDLPASSFHRKVNEDHVSCCSAIWSWHLDMIENVGRGLGVRSRLVKKNIIHGFYKGMPGRKGICCIIFETTQIDLNSFFGKDASTKVYKCFSSV